MTAASELDPYAVLGVSRNATDAEIKSAYRELVAKYHPDRHGGNPLEDLAAAKMAEINRAYEILSNPDRRADYDRGGFRTVPGGRTAAGFGVGRRPNSRVVKLIAFLLALPLLIRFGSYLYRALVALVRLVFESTQWLRGTPFALAMVLLAVVLFVFAIVRRRRLKGRGKNDEATPPN
jgi:hypothetical protein